MSVSAPPMYTYPTVPRSEVPGAHHRLSPLFLIVVGVIVAVVIVGASLGAAAKRPVPTNCHFSCGAFSGPRLVAPNVYTSSQFGYSVEYLPDSTKLADQSATGAEFDTDDGVIFFDGSSGSDVDGAVRDGVSNLNSAVIQDLQAVGSIRGAEIGLVPAKGTAYTANFVPQGGGGAFRVGVLVMAAAQGGVTVTATMISVYYTTNDARFNNYQPYGMIDGAKFDYPITSLRFAGQP
jgi:hypothetical protein